ncbi:gp228 [Bacillus phage G]|uniref:Gp228 n=1 Tax=Bacillus phage G TaxID=2884420 RepID=G3M9W9_9CAUD|nr:gp228 [Bacillus phage G]AEO93487.1 gp228 [Bacillus phage G]
MEHKNKKWDKSEKEFRTRMNQLEIRDARKLVSNIDNDPENEKRLERQECKVCFYKTKIGMSAMTYANCGFCDTKTLYGSSNVDLLCKRCAIMNEVCKHCGGEMD